MTEPKAASQERCCESEGRESAIGSLSKPETNHAAKQNRGKGCVSRRGDRGVVAILKVKLRYKFERIGKEERG